jgi:hypothetical protein
MFNVLTLVFLFCAGLATQSENSVLYLFNQLFRLRIGIRVTFGFLSFSLGREVESGCSTSHNKPKIYDAMTKKCNKCGKELPLDAFGSDAHTHDGLSCYCRKCMAKRSLEYKKITKQGRKVRLANASTKDLLHELMYRLNPLKGIFS